MSHKVLSASKIIHSVSAIGDVSFKYELLFTVYWSRNVYAAKCLRSAMYRTSACRRNGVGPWVHPTILSNEDVLWPPGLRQLQLRARLDEKAGDHFCSLVALRYSVGACQAKARAEPAGPESIITINAESFRAGYPCPVDVDSRLGRPGMTD
jgi:hypothetical protein